MSADERLLVAAQVGRAPREPWRTAARCTWGFPTAIVSPSRLADGTPFPTYAWLTCPCLAEFASARESAGAAAEWAARAADDPVLAQSLRDADAAVRALRVQESGGEDACESVGLAGQRDPLGVKCLHAHMALALVGVDDPVGSAELGAMEDDVCPDARCRKLAADAAAGG
ncbi:MAG: DUF501 domain-containing protein [Coriobacteriia bacterium]|nr:DUF501 domain-containing protein [Coriobacteriia bacterium]